MRYLKILREVGFIQAGRRKKLGIGLIVGEDLALSPQASNRGAIQYHCRGQVIGLAVEIWVLSKLGHASRPLLEVDLNRIDRSEKHGVVMFPSQTTQFGNTEWNVLMIPMNSSVRSLCSGRY